MRAFEALKDAFTKAPVLAHYAAGLRTMVETDASVFAIGGVLSQLHGEETDSRWHPVAFYSKKMTPTQQAYHTGDQEMLAIITAFEEWRHYLVYSASTVIVKTDHDNLKKFMTGKLNARQVRWAQKLAEFDFRIEYRPGKSNPADGPSRRPDHKPLINEVEEELLPSLKAKLKGVFMTRYAVFTHLERRVFAAAELVENSSGIRNPPGGQSSLGRHTRRRIQTQRDAGGLVAYSGVAHAGLNPVAGTEICRSLVPRVYVAQVMKLETAYDMPSESVTDLLRSIQREDAFVKEKRWQLHSKSKRRSVAGQQKGSVRPEPVEADSASLIEDEVLGAIMTRRGAVVPRDTEDQHGKAQGPSTMQRHSPVVAHRSETVRSSRAESVDPAHTLEGCESFELESLTMDADGQNGGRMPDGQAMGQEAEADPRAAERTAVVGDALAQRRPLEAPPQAHKGKKKHSSNWEEDETGLLRYKGRVYVPPDAAVRAEIITINHDDPYAGHLGAAKTLELIRRKYFWQKMPHDVKQWVKTCQVCQRATTKRHRPYGLLKPIEQPTGPWAQISMDFITGLPPSAHRGRIYDSVLVIVDRYTKLARYIPCDKTVTAAELADLFMEYWVKDFGTPQGIVSDRGPQFTSKFWSSLCFYLKVRRRLSTAFHPQSDGQTEVQNQTLEHYLRVYGTYLQDDWASKLVLAEFTYNNSVHSTTGISPFFAAYGTNPEIRVNVEDAIPEGEAVAAHERARLIREEREALDRHWKAAVDAQKKFYDRKHKQMVFKKDDKVMLSTKHLKLNQPSKKLADRYLGPFEVLRVSSNGMACELKLPPTWRIYPVFHISLLEPYHHRKGATLEPPPALLVNGDEEWEVETILADRKRGKGEQFLVRWKGYTSADDTWEPAKNLENASEALEKYRAAQSQKQKSQQKQGRRARRKTGIPEKSHEG